MPYEVYGPSPGCSQNNAQFYWALDQLSLIQDMENWGSFWSSFLSGLNLTIQYYDYAAMVNTYSNFNVRAILTNNTDKSPLYMNFWWYLYNDGYQLGDPSLANPAIPTNATEFTSNYELHYKITPQFLAMGLFRDDFTTWWEDLTFDGGLKYKFWGDTWIKGDVKYVSQSGYRWGNYTNLNASFTKYFLNNTIQASLTYGLPSFTGYWETDNSLQTLDQWQFSLTGKF